jgi:hypothetical protein
MRYKRNNHCVAMGITDRAEGCGDIKGSKDVLERAVLASRNGVTPGSQMSNRWRAIQNKTANSYVIHITI